jgi:hypothetical protein
VARRESVWELSQSVTERVQDDVRQLQLLGQAITKALASILVEPLPREIDILLDLLESKEEEEEKMGLEIRRA